MQVTDQAVVLADDGGGQIALGLLQLEDFFLHGVARDQPVGENLPRLPDAVRAVQFCAQLLSYRPTYFAPQRIGRSANLSYKRPALKSR